MHYFKQCLPLLFCCVAAFGQQSYLRPEVAMGQDVQGNLHPIRTDAQGRIASPQAVQATVGAPYVDQVLLEGLGVDGILHPLLTDANGFLQGTASGASSTATNLLLTDTTDSNCYLVQATRGILTTTSIACPASVKSAKFKKYRSKRVVNVHK